MTMSSPEEALSGGNVSHVVKVGNTVRRSTGPWTPTIHRLLKHVRAKGLLWVPEPLGIDEAGREMLSFIPGDVPHAMPDWIWTEPVLTGVARALRDWHDATADFSYPEAQWGLSSSSPREVICHNDFAPYNCVFKDGRFVGAIDFDFCSPGSRLWDLAYTAYRFVPLQPGPDSDPSIPGERSPFERAETRKRLYLFLATYAAKNDLPPFGPSELIATTIQRLQAIADWTEDHVRKTGSTTLTDHALMYRSHARWLASYSES